MDLTRPTEAINDISKTIDDEAVASDAGMVVIESITPSVLECMRHLDCLWREMGISVEVVEKRLEAVVTHIQQLCVDMINDETENRSMLMASIEDYQSNLHILSSELQVEPYKPTEGLKPVALQKDLRTKANEWEMEKCERVNVYKTICETEAKLCKRLDLPAHNIDTTGDTLPTKKQLEEIKINNNYMEEKLIKHVEQFKDLQLKIFNLWEDLEMIPESDFDRDLTKDGCEEWLLMSKKSIDALKDIEEKLEKEKRSNFGEVSFLWKKLESLWKRLFVEESVIKMFKNDCVGFKPSTIKKLKKELDKLETLKLQHIQKFIEGTRQELVEIWDKCFFGEAKRREFTPAFDENYTENALELHEHQLSVMENYYKENSDIYKLVEKRETMWKKLLELENQVDDPKRFSNRGGALFKEMKIRNTLSTNLPKVEVDLKRMIKHWENENCQIFVVFDDQYIELIEMQRVMYQQQKETLKAQRQKAKKAALTKEMTFGSKPIHGPPTKRNQHGVTVSKSNETHKSRSRTPSTKRKDAIKSSCSDSLENTENEVVEVSEESDISHGESQLSYDTFSSGLREQKDGTGSSTVILNSTDYTDLSTHVPSEVTQLPEMDKS